MRILGVIARGIPPSTQTCATSHKLTSHQSVSAWLTAHWVTNPSFRQRYLVLCCEVLGSFSSLSEQIHHLCYEKKKNPYGKQKSHYTEAEIESLKYSLF